jgi:hypothetical protein
MYLVANEETRQVVDMLLLLGTAWSFPEPQHIEPYFV